MKNEIGNGKDLAELILNLCMSTYELKRLYENEPAPFASLFKWTYTEVKQRTDVILGAIGVNAMLRETRNTKDFISNTLAIYVIMAERFRDKTEILPLLNRILINLTEMEKRLSKPLNERQ